MRNRSIRSRQVTDGVREHRKRAEPEGFGARGAARRAPPVEAGPGGKANFQQRLMGGVSPADEPRWSSEGPGQSAGPGRRVPRASRGGEAQAWQCPPLLSASRQTPRRQGPSAIAARRGCRFRPMVGGDGVEMGGPMMGATLGKGENPHGPATQLPSARGGGSSRARTQVPSALPSHCSPRRRRPPHVPLQGATVPAVSLGSLTPALSPCSAGRASPLLASG